jgi:glycosyltransferase involved in cell wall biosynthesis/polysaccharide pyruvyl transferase WcaK-like protein
MIVDDLRLDSNEDRSQRSARVRWSDGDFRLRVDVPGRFASAAEDASPFLCATLLLAMRLGEDLEIRGAVSARLLENLHRIIDLYAQWDSRLYRSRVTARDGAVAGRRGTGVGCFFSRGVDSMYSASVPRGLPGRLTHLIHSDRLEPIHSPAVRAEEVRLAEEAAARLGLPLVVLDTNLRELTDPIVRDWSDMAGAGLGFLATSLAGGLRHVVVPASAGQRTVIPTGTSPMLDPLFSTGELSIHHDVPANRPAKVAWLARERPDLLPWLKVCFFEDRPDNCGRCSKCLLTMLALEASGSLSLATGFPSEIDPEAMRAIRVRRPQASDEYREVEGVLREQGAVELADLIVGALERGAALPVDGELRTDSPAFLARAERQAAVAALAASAPGAAPSRAARPASPAPRVSVMMPAYNGDGTLREAVASVLGQTVGDLELIVVDDGSEEHVAELLADIGDARVRVLRHPRNRGLPAARNTALASAGAPLVSQLDADDAWELDYLESILTSFDDPGVGLAYSNCTILGHPHGHEDYIVEASIHPIDAFPKLAERNPVPCPTVTMRTLAARSVGGYADWLGQCEDYHLYMKLAQAGWRFAYVDRRLARYRWPQPGRGMSYRARRHELWEHGMFAAFVARHPHTPGPRRQVRVRTRREVELAREVIARRRPPRPPGRRPRLLVQPGSHAMLNLGDVAMLQVCVERLRRLWPEASIGVITSAPDLLERHVPGAEPVPAAGQYEWFDGRWDGGAYLSALGDRSRGRLARAARAISETGPRGARLALHAELAAREPAGDGLRIFAGWLLNADAVVMSGRGGTTDTFLHDGLQTLEMMRTAVSLGIPTAMFSQGLGPIDEPRLRREAGQVLPAVGRIALRERRSAIPLLETLGVAPDRVSVTGDDALDLAHRLRPDHLARDAIGLGLRVSEYSGIGAHLAEISGRVLRDVAGERGACVAPVTVSLYPHEADAETLRRVIGGEEPAPGSSRDSIEQAGRCRVVVAGSYHAAVFALAQGVPVVGLSATPYYDQKLRGLADLFPGGCEVLPATERDLPERLAAAVRSAWDAADERRPELLTAAERQIGAAREAYERFAQGVSVTSATVSSESASLYL